MKIKISIITVTVLLLTLINQANAQTPINSDFTYQGELVFNNQLANGAYDFEINAYDAPTDGNIYDAPYSVDAISVVNGIFQIPLDYGDETFMGDKVYLEISVRENGSGQPYELLSPRQKIYNAPYAIHAQYVGANAVSDTEILDGSIGEDDLANNIITSEKIANTAVGSSEIESNAVGSDEINSAQVQRRVSGSCSVGSYIRSVNEDGTVVCETDNTGVLAVTSEDIVDETIVSADIANNSITSVDLASNSVGSSEIVANAVGSSEIASNAVKSDEIESNAVGSSEINSTEVQRRIYSSCDEGYYIRGINEDGSVQCEQLPFGRKSDKYFLGNDSYTSMAIMPSNDFGIISFNNSLTNDLAVYVCTNFICSTGITTTLDTDGDVGKYSSIAISPSTGFPIISYYDETNGDLKVYNCTSYNCSSGSAIRFPEAEDEGQYTSITYGSNNFPIISYIDSTNNSLEVRYCFNFDCTISSDYNLDNGTILDDNTSIIIRPNSGLPLISYYADGNFKLYKCSNLSCSSGSSIVLDNNTDVGRYSDAVISHNNKPRFSYYDVTNKNLKFYRCNDENCLTGSTRVLDSIGDVGLHTSIALNRYGNEDIISYQDLTNNSLKIYKCEGTSCHVGYSETLDSRFRSGSSTSIVFTQYYKPRISYLKSGSLVIYSCYDEYCTP